jgi:5-methylthioadenosine/S-adenosylhomocysteine deaminase
MTDSHLLVTKGQVLVGAPLDDHFLEVDVRIRGSKITEIGPSLPTEGAQVIDATGTFVLPGFVDTHHHLWEATMRGLTTDGSFADFMFGVRFNHGGLHDPEDIYSGVSAGALTALDVGTTTVVDHMHGVNGPDHAHEALRAVQESGLRTVWCYGTNGGPVEVEHFSSVEDRWDLARTLRSQHFATQREHDLVQMGLAVADIGTYGWDMTASEYKLALDLELFVTSHANCFWDPAHVPQISALHQHGLLGPRQLYSHVNNSTDDELKLLASVGASVSTTPETELQMGLGHPIIARALREGVAAGLGSDMQANNSPDAFTQMRLAMHAASAEQHQRVLSGRGTREVGEPTITARQIYNSATLGGAAAAGLADVIGSVEVGKEADVILLRNDRLHHRPIVDRFATIVSQSRPDDVDTVIVGGVIRKADGSLSDSEVAQCISRVEASHERLSRKMRERGGARPTPPPGLMGQVVDAVNANLG